LPEFAQLAPNKKKATAAMADLNFSKDVRRQVLSLYNNKQTRGGLVTIRQGGQDYQLAVVSKNEEQNLIKYHKEYDKSYPTQKRRAEDTEDAPAKRSKDSKDISKGAAATQQSIVLRTASMIGFKRFSNEAGVEVAETLETGGGRRKQFKRSEDDTASNLVDGHGELYDIRKQKRREYKKKRLDKIAATRRANMFGSKKRRPGN
jgi:hypothetical protein